MRWLRLRGRERARGTPRRLGRLGVAVATGAILAGGALLGVAASAIVAGPSPGDRDATALIAATHLPPLLTAPGEGVTLRYDVYCAPPGPDPESGAPCDAGGTVYVRPGESGEFRPIELRLDPSATGGRYVAEMPTELAAAREGLSYYAVLRSRTTGATTTLPAGGASAPMQARPLGPAELVSL